MRVDDTAGCTLRELAGRSIWHWQRGDAKLEPAQICLGCAACRWSTVYAASIRRQVENRLVDGGLLLLDGEQGEVLEDLVPRDAVASSDDNFARANGIPGEANAGLKFLPVRRRFPEKRVVPGKHLRSSDTVSRDRID